MLKSFIQGADALKATTGKDRAVVHHNNGAMETIKIEEIKNVNGKIKYRTDASNKENKQ